MSLKETLIERLGDRVEVEANADQTTIAVHPRDLVDVAKTVRDDEDLGFDLLLDLCAVDYPKRDERFETVSHLYSTTKDQRLRIKTRLPEEDPHQPTLVDVWPAANWYEREAWDLMGVRFDGHPNLKRILTHEGFAGHALRKDYAAGQRWQCVEQDLLIPDQVLDQDEVVDHFETQVLNMGPSHPATHGTLRIVMRLDGEKIVGCECEIGYLHRCFEKMAEEHFWNQVIPYTDRLNYCSPMLNGIAYARTVEEMVGCEVPERATRIRLILGEFSRIMDHLVCLGTNLVDIGALTNFWYLFQPRELIYDLIEACCGARLTVSYVRIGGLADDVPADFVPRVRGLLRDIPKYVEDMEKLILNNQIFRNRTRGVATVTKEQALAWGFTGPCLRASGVPLDLRKVAPYDGYDRYDWDVPYSTDGDIFARFMVRVEEIKQSLKIIGQAIEDLPEGPVITDDWRVALPPKDRVYNEMEPLIWHFKLIYEGTKVPAGEHYSAIEGANGELGFYAVSDGSGKPHRLKVRPPCFPIFAAFAPMMTGQMVSDAVANLGSLNIIAGELDR